MLLQNIAVCVPDVHKPASLPGAANCGVRSWPRLPSILKDNLLTSNGLSSFCLSPCGNQRVFLSIPLPPSSSPSEMLKHLVASKQGQTTNTWMSIFFFFYPPLPRDLQLHDSQILEAVSGTFLWWLSSHQKQPLTPAVWLRGPLLWGWPHYLTVKWCGATTPRHDVMGLDVSPEEIQASWCCNLITRWFLFPCKLIQW